MWGGAGEGPRAKRAEQAGAGVEMVPGMWLEGERQARPLPPRRLVAGRRDQALMAPVDAVEIPDGGDGAVEFGRKRVAVATDREG